MCKKHLALLPCVLEQVSITCQNTLYARCDSLIIAGAGNEVFGKIVHIMVSKKQNNIIQMPLLELYYRTEILYQIFWFYVFVRVAIVTEEDKLTSLMILYDILPCGESMNVTYHHYWSLSGIFRHKHVVC